MANGIPESPSSDITSARQVLNQIKGAHDPKGAGQAAMALLKYYQRLDESGMLPSMAPIEEERKLIREAIDLIKTDKDRYRKPLKVLRQALSLLGEHVRERVEEALGTPGQEGDDAGIGLNSDELAVQFFGDMDDGPEAGSTEERMTTGEIDQLMKDMDELTKATAAKIPKKRKISEEEMARRKLLQRFSVNLRKPLKRLFEISDFNPERIEGDDDYHEYARGLLANIQEEIYDVLMAIPDDELEAIRKLPYKEKKEKLEEIRKNFDAFVDDIHAMMAMIGLEKFIPDKNIYPSEGPDTDEEVIDLDDNDVLEAESEPETAAPITPGAFDVPPADIPTPEPAPSAPTPPRPSPSRAPAASPPPAPRPAPDVKTAPPAEEMIKLMENDETIRGLMDKLEIIREGFGEVEKYRQTGTPPEGFKDDISTFNDIFDKRNAKGDPLITSESREALAANYIDLLESHAKTLFEHWDETAFLTEMTKRLKRVYINNKKLLKDEWQ
ncbi:hypothetical protein JW752_01905 [Candidatus Peregrinibacteria bacterium]|nr:hypothetical protein [Candidatus Peregrinibacteria bacterium]